MEGFLCQITSFPLEILIHDDASNDGTDEIINEYVRLYPSIILPIFETENQYSHGDKRIIDFYNYQRARGKYIAYCEGDDYWTDPYKLQKQVDFLETHPDYSVCFHRCRHWEYKSGRLLDDACEGLLADNKDGIDITMAMFFDKWVTQPLTMMFRVSSFSFDWYTHYKYYRDSHEIYHLLKSGKGRLLNFYGGVRIKHEHGVSSSMKETEHCKLALEIARELYYENYDEATKENYIRALQWYLCLVNTSFFERFSSCFELLRISHRVKVVLKLFLKAK